MKWEYTRQDQRTACGRAVSEREGLCAEERAQYWEPILSNSTLSRTQPSDRANSHICTPIPKCRGKDLKLWLKFFDFKSVHLTPRKQRRPHNGTSESMWKVRRKDRQREEAGLANSSHDVSQACKPSSTESQPRERIASECGKHSKAINLAL